LELQAGQKLGRFPALSRAENSQQSSNKGLNEAGEPNFLRIFEPAKSVQYDIAQKIHGLAARRFESVSPKQSICLWNRRSMVRAHPTVPFKSNT